MNILIVYESDHGQTERVASALAETLRAEGHSATLSRASARPSIWKYDAVLVGGSVRIGKLQPALIDLCKEHREELARKPNAFFSVSVSARRTIGPGLREVAKAFGRFIAETGWTPQRLWPIAGALRYSQYPLWVRAMLVFIAMLSGGDTDTSRDYEYTDWKALDALGVAFCRALPHGARGASTPTLVREEQPTQH